MDKGHFFVAKGHFFVAKGHFFVAKGNFFAKGHFFVAKGHWSLRVGGLIFYEVGFAYFRVVRSVDQCLLLGAKWAGLMEKVVEQCFLDAVLKGLVKKVAKLWIFVVFLRGRGGGDGAILVGLLA